MTKALLEATDLSCSRGGLTVLQGVTLSIVPGQVLILRGPNGSGKTTLLRTLSGLQPADSGRIDCEPDSIAYSAHADGIKATLTVGENLGFWAELYGTGSVDDAIEALDLRDLRNRQARTLSAGQKRRLGLARLLVAGRKIWAMDEPTVSLDQASVAQFVATLNTHAASGGGAIIATHIDLGLEGETLDITRFGASVLRSGAFDEAFT